MIKSAETSINDTGPQQIDTPEFSLDENTRTRKGLKMLLVTKHGMPQQRPNAANPYDQTVTTRSLRDSQIAQRPTTISGDYAPVWTTLLTSLKQAASRAGEPDSS